MVKWANALSSHDIFWSEFGAVPNIEISITVPVFERDIGTERARDFCLAISTVVRPGDYIFLALDGRGVIISPPFFF